MKNNEKKGSEPKSTYGKSGYGKTPKKSKEEGPFIFRQKKVFSDKK